MNSVEIVDKTTGTSLPKRFIHGIKKSFLKFCSVGCVSGQPITAIVIYIMEGDSHIVDSSDIAFEHAVKGCMQQTFQLGSWSLLEPLMAVSVTCPSQFSANV